MSFRLIGIGELLWDLLPGGRKLGGAPANFTYHAAALGAEACLVSRVGRDMAGSEALDQLERLGIPTAAIEIDPRLPTGHATVEIADDGQPRFTIHERVAWDALTGEIAGHLAVTRADAICFGTLAQRSDTSRKTIRRLLREAPPSALRILDVNLRSPYFSKALIEDSLSYADVLKLNEAELGHLAQMFLLRGDIRDQLRKLAESFELECIACTRGSNGSVLLAGDQWSDLPGMAAEVVDTVGAGDAFTAALALGLLARWPLEEVNRRASELAAFVCSQAGATPRLPEASKGAFVTSAHVPNLP